MDVCSIALFSDRSVFLIARAFAPYAGFWTLPGGRLEAGETHEACIKREVREETGFVLDAALRVVTRPLSRENPMHRLTVFTAFHSRAVPRTNNEIAAWDWVDRAALGAYATTPDLEAIVTRCRAVLDAHGQRR